MIGRYLYLIWLRHRLRRFLADAKRSRDFQHRALLQKIARHSQSDFGRAFGFSELRTVADIRKRLPILTYEDHHPYVQRVLQGDVTALFAPRTRVLMFAMTSGTTGEPKRLPITEELFREYTAGWRLWGAGVYGDHRELVRTKTLQLTSDWQQYRAPCGAPCGQISGLAAITRPRVARRIFLPPLPVARIYDTAAKHYTALRFALASDRVGMIITANPSTLVEFARRANEQSESLIRDIHDGTLSCRVPRPVRTALARRIARRDPARARCLERLIEQHGALRPVHAWPKLAVLAVWTGGSGGLFLPQLTELYGRTAIRDHGLSASEGRMSIPLADGTAAGLLDFYHHYFEFIPAEEYDRPQRTVLEAHELQPGRDYFIVLTTAGGLYRYDIHDVVRCVGFEGQAPLIEFLNKGKHFSNLTGEKLSEHQAIRAVEKSFQELQLPIDVFTLAPVVEKHPRYVLLLEPSAHRGRGRELAARVQANLERLNEEYAAKTRSERLLPVEIREVPDGTWRSLRHEKTSRNGSYEQYKHPCLVNDVEFVARHTSPPRTPAFSPHLPSLPWGAASYGGSMSGSAPAS
jgi:hypothetical protein